MRVLGNNLHNTGNTLYVHNFCEPHQFVLEISSYEFAPIEICGVLLLDSIEVLSIMPESAPLPDRGFIVNVPNSLHKSIVELNGSYSDTQLRGPPDVPPRFLR